jgi:para-nitrobenzyl esterase
MDNNMFKIKDYICTPDNPLVKTSSGLVRGFISDGTRTFLGLRYAVAERFCKPSLFDSWDDIKDYRAQIDDDGVYNALEYGSISPTPFDFNDIPPWGDHLLPHRYWMAKEACQYLNVWTPGTDGKQHPVMVWLHGGGFFAGSATDLYAYHGENLSRSGDVVVVTINHRLNMLGYLNMSAYGEKYEYSANVGMHDIIAALKWIQKNIAAFGGDPSNVTIFGQSGGGAKVTALMQMPDADGLYHKAIMQSGVLGGGIMSCDREAALKKADAIVKNLGLTKKTIGKIDTIAYSILSAASNAAAKSKTGDMFDRTWAPSPDASFIGAPTETGFRPQTNDIPVIIGTNMCEFIPSPRGDKSQWTKEQNLDLLRQRYSESNAKLLLKEFENAYPELNSAYSACVDTLFRKSSLAVLDQRINDSSAPAYNYIFTFESTHMGAMMIGHSAEIGFVFRNAGELHALCRENVTARLQEEMSQSWVHFARTGSPNRNGFKEWPQYTAKDGACMAFGNTTMAKKGKFDSQLLELSGEILDRK